MTINLIKSKNRVRDVGEVFTPDLVFTKTIVGIPAKNLKKILLGLTKNKQQSINEGIVRFRSQELEEHNSFKITAPL